MRTDYAVREQIAAEIRQKIAEYEPHCSPQYIRGMKAALLYVTGEAHQPLFAPPRSQRADRCASCQHQRGTHRRPGTACIACTCAGFRDASS